MEQSSTEQNRIVPQNKLWYVFEKHGVIIIQPSQSFSVCLSICLPLWTRILLGFLWDLMCPSNQKLVKSPNHMSSIARVYRAGVCVLKLFMSAHWWRCLDLCVKDASLFFCSLVFSLSAYVCLFLYSPSLYVCVCVCVGRLWLQTGTQMGDRLCRNQSHTPAPSYTDLHMHT